MTEEKLFSQIWMLSEWPTRPIRLTYIQFNVMSSPTYEDQAFYRALDQLMLKQAQRLINAAGELDGRSWADK